MDPRVAVLNREVKNHLFLAQTLVEKLAELNDVVNYFEVLQSINRSSVEFDRACDEDPSKRWTPKSPR